MEGVVAETAGSESERIQSSVVLWVDGTTRIFDAQVPRESSIR